MVADFLTLDSAPETETLLAKYQIGSDITDRRIHETELSNWLSDLATHKE